MKNYKSDKYLPYLVIVGVVAIALLFLWGGRIEGAPTYKTTVDTYQDSCTDDDSKNDYYTAGTVKQGRIEYADHCKGSTLYQYHCASSQTVRLTRPYECPLGCLYGACLTQE